MSRGFTWEDEIEVAVLVRQDLQVADTVPLWEYDFPRVAATQEDVRDAERALGFALDEQVREFLLRADGWESFYQDVDLFGTPEFREQATGESLMTTSTKPKQRGFSPHLASRRRTCSPLLRATSSLISS